MKGKDGCHTMEPIGSHAWRLDELGLSNSYLVLGQERALLIDTSNGAGDLRACVEELTPLPVTVAVTHRHPDHTGGAWRFGAYYAAAADQNFACNVMCLPICSAAMVRLKRRGAPVRRPVGKGPKVLTLPPDHVFDLGGVQIRTEAIPGHTRGSLLFVDDEDRILYTGDDVNPCLWVHLPGSTKLRDWFAGAERVRQYLAKGYTAYCGHGGGRQTLEQVEETCRLAREVLAKHASGELPPWGTYPSKKARPNITSSPLSF